MNSNIVSPDFSAVRPEIPRSSNEKQMLQIEVGPDLQTTVRINSSSLAIILACGRKSWYLLERGLKTRSESPALTFGKAIHKALEVFYTYPKAVRSIPHNFKEVSDLMAFAPAENRAIQAEEHFLFAAIDAFVTEAQPLMGIPDTDKRSIPNGIWILQEYFKSYINDPYVTYSDAQGTFTERTGEAVIFEDRTLRIIVFGTIDLVLKNELSGNILPADHKTTSIVGADFFNRLKPNHQYSGYILLAQRVFGILADEFLVNGIEVKARPKTSRGKGPNFTRQVTKRSDEDLREFIQTVEFAVRSYLGWRESDVWPMGHVNECASYGGCQFLEVCSAPNSLRENLIEAKFVPPKN